MDHEPDLNRIAALADGRLDRTERERLVSHLAQCRQCRDVLSLLAGQPVMSPAGAWWRRPAVWLPVAATLVVASVSVLLVNGPGRSSSEGPTSLSPSASPAPASPAPPLPTPSTPAGASPALKGPPDTPAAPSAPPRQVQPKPPPDDELLRRRGGTQQVGGKTFRLVAGEWIDSSYDVGALLPVVEVASSAARRELLARVPALTPFAALGDRVTVVHEGTVYRFSMP